MDQNESPALKKYLDNLNVDSDKREFIKKRILAFEEIKKLISKAQKETLRYYKKNPNYSILYGTDIIKDSLSDILTTLNSNEES
jgi:hypothetical protein